MLQVLLDDLWELHTLKGICGNAPPGRKEQPAKIGSVKVNLLMLPSSRLFMLEHRRVGQSEGRETQVR